MFGQLAWMHSARQSTQLLLCPCELHLRLGDSLCRLATGRALAGLAQHPSKLRQAPLRAVTESVLEAIAFLITGRCSPRPIGGD